MNNFSISGKSTSPRTESDIRLNYRDLSKIIAATNDLKPNFIEAIFFSTDGGKSWNPSKLPLAANDVGQFDPAVDWTSDSTAWALCIGADSQGNRQGNRRLRAYRSTDKKGDSWTLDGTPSGDQNDCDREIIWVDHSPTSPYKDRIYATWTNGNFIFFARRTADGAWHAPKQLSGAETIKKGIGGDIKTNSFGDVFVFWTDIDGSRNILVRKSNDGGFIFGDPVIIATTFASTRKLIIPANFGKAGARVHISAGAYRTATKDNVYAVWTDLNVDPESSPPCNSGSGPGTEVGSTCKTRVWFSRSTRGGEKNTWETVMLDDQVFFNDQFHPKLCVDESNGNLIVTYYDTFDPKDPNGRLKTNVWMKMSTDDGQTWSAPVLVTSAQTDETSEGAAPSRYGDYNGLSGFAGVFFPSWTDRRGGGPNDREEIWTAPILTTKPKCSIITDRSMFNKDEINAQNPSASAPVIIDPAFYVTVDGFRPIDLGIEAPDLLSGTPNPNAIPAVPIPPNLTGVLWICTKLIGNDPTHPYNPQRLRWIYQIQFTDVSDFPSVPPQPVGTINQVTLSATVTSQVASYIDTAELSTSVSDSAIIQLIDAKPLPAEKLCNSESTKKPNPIFGDGALGNEMKGKMYYTGSDRKKLVETVQKMLKTLDHDCDLGSSGTNKDGVDGVFGELTENAVKDFQEKNKDWDGEQLKVDGLVGPETSDALNRAMVGKWYEHYQTPKELVEGKPYHTVTSDFLAKGLEIEPGKAKNGRVFLVGLILTIRLIKDINTRYRTPSTAWKWEINILKV